jgi:hypothetical protein
LRIAPPGAGNGGGMIRKKTRWVRIRFGTHERENGNVVFSYSHTYRSDSFSAGRERKNRGKLENLNLLFLGADPLKQPKR